MKITPLEGAILANAVYGNDDTEFVEPEGYVLAKDTNGDFITFSDSTTDLQMALYQNTTTGNYVVAFRGTASASDWGTDIQMGISTLIGVLANQFTPASVTLANWIRDFSLSSSNTTIVGHSLGGALAQYFGANTGFETLTYNAYGAGNIDGAASGGSNITNYVTIGDPVSKLPMSSMIGTTYMLQNGDLLDMLGHGITNFTSEESSGGECPPPGGSDGGSGGEDGGHCPSPINPLFSFHFHIPVPVSPPASSESGDPVNIAHHGVVGSSIQGKPLIPGPTNAQCINHPNYNSAGAGGGGGSTGPIVLDLNHDGITSISIAASIALFDYDGDGIKENTAWIQSTDALLVNDVWFDRDVKDTKSTIDYTQISDDIKSLGNISGSGDVEDLAIAMSKDSVLMTKVEALINAIEIIKVNFNDERMVA